MGLFDFFKKRTAIIQQIKATHDVKNTIPESEKKCYQSDEDYTPKVHEGAEFEKYVNRGAPPDLVQYLSSIPDFKWTTFNDKYKLELSGIYRGIKIKIEWDRDTWSRDLWIELPKGLLYEENGIPYRWQFDCGGFGSKNNSSYDTIEGIRNALQYIDKYYDYFEPFIDKYCT